MQVDKDLAIYFAAKDAPKEVKEAADSYWKCYQRLLKANAQLEQWKVEAHNAASEYSTCGKVFKEAISNWDIVKSPGLVEKK